VLILSGESEGTALELLDTALSLVTVSLTAMSHRVTVLQRTCSTLPIACCYVPQVHVHIGSVLLWRPTSTSDRWQQHNVLEISGLKVCGSHCLLLVQPL
jgi:hypothetical protein